MTFIECIIWWTNKHHLRLDEHFTISECDADVQYEHWELNTVFRIRVHNEWLWHYPKTIAHTNTSAQHSTYSKLKTHSNHFFITSHISHPLCLVHNVDMLTINVSFEINDAITMVYWLELISSLNPHSNSFKFSMNWFQLLARTIHISMK